MAVVVTSQLTTVDACDSATPGWTLFGTVASLAAVQASDEEQTPFAGTYCYAFDADIENGGHYATFTQTDYSSKICYIAFCCWTASTLQVLAPGGGAQSGIYIVGVDSSGNQGYWHVAGSDTYKGGWRVFVADLSRAPDTNSGTAPTMSQCTGLGIGVNHLAKCKATHNCFIDLLRIADSGQGLKITTTSSTVATLQDIVIGDGTDLLRQEGGIFFAKAPLTFGDTTSGDIEFAETGKVLVFEDLDVPSEHYKIVVQGNSSGTTSFKIGTLSGSAAVSGGIIRATGTKRFLVTATDTNIDTLELYGCSFYRAGVISLPVYSSTRKVIGCSFESCSQMTVSTCTVTRCNFITSEDAGGSSGAVLISSTSHAVTQCNFIACPDAWHVNTAGTYGCNANKFVGNTYDIGNSSAGFVTINATNLADPSTYENTGGGTTSIKSLVYLDVNVTNTAGTALQYVQCYIEKATPAVYTSIATGNNQGDLDFVIQETPSTDTPSTGWLRVVTAEQTEQLYRYASVAISTFTLETKIGPYACSGGGTSTSLQDTVRDFTALNIQVGDTIRNETDVSWAIVLAIVDADNITTTPLQGGSNNTWTSGDNWSVHTLALGYDAGDSAFTPYMNEETDSSGDAQSVMNYPGTETDIRVKVRKYGYKTFKGAGSVTSSGFSTNIILAVEPNIGM